MIWEGERENHYVLFCTLDGCDDLIADDDQLDKYEPWCCNFVVDENVEYYELDDNEGVVI